MVPISTGLTVPSIPYSLPIKKGYSTDILVAVAKSPIHHFLLTMTPFYNFVKEPVTFHFSEVASLFNQAWGACHRQDYKAALHFAQLGSDFFLNPQTSIEAKQEDLLVRIYFVYLRAICHCALNDEEESIKDLSLIAFAAPSVSMQIWAITLRNRFFLRSSSPDVDAVIFNSQLALEMAPDLFWESEIYFNLALALALIHKIDEGRPSFQKARQISPFHPFLPLLAQIYDPPKMQQSH